MTQNAAAYSSEDPEIQALIDFGLKQLEQAVKEKQTVLAVDRFHTVAMGEPVLAAYAHFKVAHDADHPVVKQGIDAALKIVRGVSTGRDPGGNTSATVYSAAVSTLLLAEVDSERYMDELKQLEKYFRRVQYNTGGYGYLGLPLGDVSQTQYAMLALWTLDQKGLIIDYDGIVRTIKWLLRVQDPSGGWPYMGTVPSGPGLQKQSDVRLTMAYAGGCTLLIAADILQLWDENKENQSVMPGLPRAVQFAKENMPNALIKRPKVPVDPILVALKNCQQYASKHDKFKVSYPFYNVYTIERFESFVEVALNLEKKPDAPWYDEGVNFLKSTKAKGWTSNGHAISKSTAASFAVLFLMRSTQRAIEQAATQALAGGRELPKDTTQITVDKGKIKGKPVAMEMGNLLKMLEQDGANSIEGKSIPENLKLADDPRERAAQLDRMERLVRGSRSWQARRVACRLLGQSDELKVVPTLIYALTDPDPMVPRYARDGLRFISRKFEGFGLSDSPNAGEIANAQKKWREWYRTMDPGYVFIDFDL